MESCAPVKLVQNMQICRANKIAIADKHTQIVRQANVSSKRTIPLVLPYQNQAGGDDLKLCATTFLA